MIRVISLVFGLLLVTSCDQNEQEVKSLKEIIPMSDRDYDKKKNEDLDQDTLQQYRSIFTTATLGVNDIGVNDKKMFPDRFRPDSVVKLNLIRNLDTIEFFRWDFLDSTKLSSAFYNWLDVFGANKIELTPGLEVSVQRDPFMLFLGDTSLVFINNESKLKEWQSFLNHDMIDRSWKWILVQKRKRKVEWFSYFDEKLTKYELDEDN